VSEKLTRQELQQWLIKGGDTGWMIGDMWDRIEADREAVREEVRAEWIMTYYAPGERVQVYNVMLGKWVDGIAGASDRDGGLNWTDPSTIRRPAKKRPMTRKEMIDAISNPGRNIHDPSFRPLDIMKDETLIDICHAYNIPTETDQP